VGIVSFDIEADIPTVQHTAAYYRKCQEALALQEAGELFVPCRCRVRIRAPSCRPRAICNDHSRHQGHSNLEITHRH
jgi:hypothetical protein